jgi:hypothetical protein
VTMIATVSGVVMVCNLLGGYRQFTGTCCFQFKVRKHVCLKCCYPSNRLNDSTYLRIAIFSGHVWKGHGYEKS